MIKILNELDFRNSGAIDLDMNIEADGSNLSAGQKQIICFCRIVLSRRKLVILDEATANVDLKTEKNVSKL